MSLPTRALGKNGPQVTGMGLGLMGLSGFYGPVLPTEERLKFLDQVYATGEVHWDSADMYVDSEDLLGEWFKRNPEKRKNIFLTTKFANKTLPDGSRTVDSSPEYALEAIDKSLKRLGLPYVDLYYCHRVDGKTPVEETAKALKKIKESGKAKYLGMSECSARTLRRAHSITPISAVQMEYSPFSLEIESPQTELLKTARELGIAVVAYSPIGRGLITGSIKGPEDFADDDFRKSAPRFSKENFHKNIELTEKIGAIAKKKNVTASQITLAWLLAQGEDIFPIPGTTKIERLKENLDALKIVLTPEENKEIRQACENAEVTGARYGPAMMKVAFGDTPELTASA